MAKVSGGTRQKMPSRGQSGKPMASQQQAKGEFKYTRIRSKNSDTEISRLSDADLERLNVAVTKILKDAGVSLENAKFTVSDITNSFIFSSDGINLARDVYPNGEMHHAYFKIIDKDSRGKGVSKAIHRELIPLYEQMGIKKISVDAGLENGGHTWAQYGFHVSKNQADWLAEELPIGSIKQRAITIIDNYYYTHDKNSKFPMYLLSSDGVINGKARGKKSALAGKTWSGTIDLTDPAQKKYFYDYVGYKK